MMSEVHKYKKNNSHANGSKIEQKNRGLLFLIIIQNSKHLSVIATVKNYNSPTEY